MKDQDLLHEAAKALRECTDGTSPCDGQTREKVLLSLDVEKRRRRTLHYALPLAAAFIVAAVLVSPARAAIIDFVPSVFTDVWDAVTGAGQAPDQEPRPEEPLALGSNSKQAASDRSASSPQRGTEGQSAPEVSPDETQTPLPMHDGEPLASQNSSLTPSKTERMRAPSEDSALQKRQGERSSLQISEQDQDESTGHAEKLYRDAHHAHFVAQNPAAALAAWNRYLAAAPQGAFVLEARYNRAVAMLRLGRLSQASAALRPFVEGVHRGYRQQEAARLLEVIEGRMERESSDAPPQKQQP